MAHLDLYASRKVLTYDFFRFLRYQYLIVEEGRSQTFRLL